MASGGGPIFSAVSHSTYQLYTLLRCVAISSQACVQITPQGIRFSVEDGRVMQGLTILDKSLFTNYLFNAPTESNNTDSQPNDEDNELSDSSYPRFMISLSAIIDTLQIFGITEPSQGQSQVNSGMNTQAMNSFSTPALGFNRSCRISYLQEGSPLCITLTEAGITTTCELTTYELDSTSLDSPPEELDIPLQRDSIVFKIIMRSTWLHNAIVELNSTSPTVLSLSASPQKPPFFALSASGGPFSESTIEFDVDKEAQSDADPAYKSFNEDGSSRQPRRGKLAPAVTETFLVQPPASRSRVKQRYKFALLRKALRAMAEADKVSIRGDSQGVLGLQFMIDLSDGGKYGNKETGQGPGNVSFVEFRFVPLIDEEESDEDSVNEL